MCESGTLNPRKQVLPGPARHGKLTQTLKLYDYVHNLVSICWSIPTLTAYIFLQDGGMYVLWKTARPETYVPGMWTGHMLATMSRDCFRMKLAKLHSGVENATYTFYEGVLALHMMAGAIRTTPPLA